MSAKTTHFKVENGDMTLIEFESGRRLLVDIKIRAAADDPDDETPDVGSQLRERLTPDGQGRLFVDAFLLSHPDQDHCAGLQSHFHLGPLSQWKKADNKIIIREMWSSPIVFRRAEKDHILCEDAKAWSTEARRRVNLFKNQGFLSDGDRIQILGEDVDGKTDDLGAILVKAGTCFSTICGATDASFESLLLAPLLGDGENEEEVLSKNNSSIIMRLTLAANGVAAAARYLLGGDAEVAIWEKIWDQYTPDDLKYEVLLAPHHCSWHSLSWDSWSEKGNDAKVSEKARSALAQVAPGATILSSSCTIKDDDNDPPCIRAKREYAGIVKPAAGTFRCLADEAGDDPFELLISEYGPKPDRKRLVSLAGLETAVGSEALGHG
jgi:hypothetical protein